MYRLFAIAMGCFAISSVCGQTVEIRNVSYPGTALEVGNTVGISITGAAPFSSVTVVQNGAPPFFFGTTDGLGNWSITAVETAANIGSYHQIWYVSGIPANPANLSNTYALFAPKLPSFDVFSNYIGPNDPAASTLADNCNGGTNLAKWTWTPIGYTGSSTYGNISTAANLWNSATTGKLSLQPSVGGIQNDIIIANATIPTGFYALTYDFTQRCDTPCYNRTNICNGACLNDQAMYYSDIYLSPSALNAGAFALSIDVNAFTTTIIAHEIGHSLGVFHSDLTYGRCSEAQGIMYPEGGIVFNCGRTSPTSSDINTINFLYPSSPGYCPLGNNACYSTSGPC